MSLGGAPLEQTVPRRYRNVLGVRGATSTSPMCQGGLSMLRLLVAATVPYQARRSARPKCSLSRQSGLWFCTTDGQATKQSFQTFCKRTRCRRSRGYRLARLGHSANPSVTDACVYIYVTLINKVATYTLQPFNPSSFQPFNTSTLQPFNQSFNPSIL